MLQISTANRGDTSVNPNGTRFVGWLPTFLEHLLVEAFGDPLFNPVEQEDEWFIAYMSDQTDGDWKVVTVYGDQGSYRIGGRSTADYFFVVDYLTSLKKKRQQH